MACTASSDCSKVTVPIPRLFPSLSSLTSARFTTPAMPNTSFNFFQPTLKSSWKTRDDHCFYQQESSWLAIVGNGLLLCPHIGYKHRVAKSSGLQSMDDVRWDVRVVGNGGRDVHPARPHVLPATSLLTSSHALKHTSSMFTIRVLKIRITLHFTSGQLNQDNHNESIRSSLSTKNCTLLLHTWVCYLGVFQGPFH